MPAVEDQLRQYAAAMADPIDGAILIELDRVDAATPTTLARQLGLSLTEMYPHIRRLRSQGVIQPAGPDATGETIEQMVAVSGEVRAALRLDPSWFNRMGDQVSPAGRKKRYVALCLTMSILLRRAAEHLDEADDIELDSFIREYQSLVLSVNRLSPEQLAHRVHALHDLMVAEGALFAEDTSPRTEMMVLATLPSFIWDREAMRE